MFLFVTAICTFSFRVNQEFIAVLILDISIAIPEIVGIGILAGDEDVN